LERQQRNDQAVRQVQQQRAQPKTEQPSSPRAEGARIGNPVKGKAPRPQVQPEAPRPQVKQNQPGRGEAKQQNKAPGQPKGGGGVKGKGKP
jgi:hypothetical protein